MQVGKEETTEGDELAEEDGAEAEGGGGLGGALLALEATDLLTQEADPGVTALVDSHNGFNKLSHLVMLCMVRRIWPEESRFAFNCYRHWAQLLLCQPGDAPVIILVREGVTQGDYLLMVLYGVTLVPLAEEFRDADPTLLSPFYVGNA